MLLASGSRHDVRIDIATPFVDAIVLNDAAAAATTVLAVASKLAETSQQYRTSAETRYTFPSCLDIHHSITRLLAAAGMHFLEIECLVARPS